MEDIDRAVDAVAPHIQEMRQRMIRVVAAFFVCAVGMFYFSSDILEWLQTDLDLSLNALAAYEVIYTQLFLAALLGFLVTLPYALYHLLKFLEPGLKKNEYRVLRNYLPLFIVLFAAGSLFSYNFVVKASLQFFYNLTASSGVEAVWGLQNTILFVVKISALTGILFQLPIIAAVLSKAGFISAAQMKENRAYFAIGILVLAAVATPPDLITQVLIAVPVIGLYQLSIILVARMEGVRLL